MKVVCPGWVEPRHAPKDIREMRPLSDKRISHGMCKDCERALNQKADAKERRWV